MIETVKTIIDVISGVLSILLGLKQLGVNFSIPNFVNRILNYLLDSYLFAIVVLYFLGRSVSGIIGLYVEWKNPIPISEFRIEQSSYRDFEFSPSNNKIFFKNTYGPGANFGVVSIAENKHNSIDLDIKSESYEFIDENNVLINKTNNSTIVLNLSNFNIHETTSKNIISKNRVSPDGKYFIAEKRNGTNWGFPKIDTFIIKNKINNERRYTVSASNDFSEIAISNDFVFVVKKAGIGTDVVEIYNRESGIRIYKFYIYENNFFKDARRINAIGLNRSDELLVVSTSMLKANDDIDFTNSKIHIFRLVDIREKMK